MESIVKFFERVYGIKKDDNSKYGYIILNNDKGVINNNSFEDIVQDAYDKMGIKMNAHMVIYEDESELNLELNEIEEMLCFCMENCPSNFIESLYRFYIKRGYLSDKQLQILEKMYDENL